jgi:hypothetical protein
MSAKHSFTRTGVPIKHSMMRYVLKEPIPVTVGENVIGRISELEVYKEEKQQFVDKWLLTSKSLSVCVLYNDGVFEWERVSTHLPNDSHLGENEFFVKNYSESEYFYNALIEHGIISETGNTEPAGFVNIPICKFHAETYDFCTKYSVPHRSAPQRGIWSNERHKAKQGA